MISSIVVSLFGAAYNWPLGAAISLCMLVLVVTLLFLVERLEKKLTFDERKFHHRHPPPPAPAG